MSQLKDLLTRYKISPKKSLGQHFVSDPNTIQRIIRFAEIEKTDAVIEIGAGVGALTLGLAEVAKKVIAIETDGKLLPALNEVVSGIKNIQIIHEDALALDFEELIKKNLSDSNHKLVANLPYNIAARLILQVLESSPSILELTVMVQKEVAKRFLAKPRTSAFGLVSLKAQYYAEISSGGKVSPQVFYPKPDVDSELLKLKRLKTLEFADPKPIFQLATTAFQKKRKMLRKSLAGIIDSEGFLSAGIDGSARPEELNLKDWGALLQIME